MCSSLFVIYLSVFFIRYIFMYVHVLLTLILTYFIHDLFVVMTIIQWHYEANSGWLLVYSKLFTLCSISLFLSIYSYVHVHPVV